MNFNSKYKLPESYGNIETHEIFLDSLAHQKEEAFGLSEKKFEVAIKTKIIFSLFGLFFLCAAVLLAKTIYLQTFDGHNLYVLGQNNKARIGLISPERGIIYDSNMTKLVSNSAAFDLVCDKRNFFPDNQQYAKEITIAAQILNVNPFQIQDQIKNSEESEVLVAENITQETLLVLEARIGELPDCSIEQSIARNYAMGSVFSHLLGYTSKATKDDLQSTDSVYSISDYTGKTGLEKQYESYLRGTPGQTETIKNATGVSQSSSVLVTPKAGNSLVLNVDAKLQKVVYDALEKSIKNIGSSKGAAVAIDPRTGAVLALVSYPAYDNNIFSQGISKQDYNTLINDPNQPFFDRAIAAKYPTGSAIKPFEASGALQEKLIDPNTLINDPGYIIVHSQYDPSITYKFSGVTPHGEVDMRKALAVSSNIYFYTIGGGYGSQKGLGPAGIKKYLDMYGWEQKTGIDLPGEFGGFVPTPAWKKKTKNESWWDGDTYNLSIGQSDLQVTPLQVAVAYCAIANGGTLYQPQIVNRIIDNSDGSQKVVQQFTPNVMGQISIDPANLQVVREGMRDGVDKSYGGSAMLNDLPVAVAGKTGTAETGRPGFYNTWSANFAPYDNPEIVFLATIEGVQGLRAATLPVAHDVLQWYFTQK